MGRASSSWGARPICLPSRPRAVLPIVVVAFAAVCSTFFLRIGWLCADPECRPAFLDSLCARYARVRILCARAGAVRVRVSRSGARGLCLGVALWLLRAQPGFSPGVIEWVNDAGTIG